jgi:hypothetical protein
MQEMSNMEATAPTELEIKMTECYRTTAQVHVRVFQGRGIAGVVLHTYTERDKPRSSGWRHQLCLAGREVHYSR